MKRLILAFALFLPLAAIAQVGMPFPGPGGRAHSGGGSSWCTLIPQSGLTNCWPWDTANTTTSTATDVKGGQNATLTAVTLNGSGPSTNLNNAGVFNGTTSEGPTTLANLPTSTFSISYWIQIPTGGGNGNRVFANDHSDADNNGFQMRFNSDMTPRIDIGNGTVLGFFTTTTALTANTWAMVTWTWDGTNILGYLNGTALTQSGGSPTVTAPMTAGSVNAAFGFNPAYGADFYNGKLAGVAVYNRVLSPTEVATINGL